MPRGKGIRRFPCFCRYPPCSQNFLGTREDSKTCTPRCRKALNRLMGGDDEGRREGAVTDQMNEIYRVLLDGKWIATKTTRIEAEQLIADLMQEWDGEFTVKPIVPKQRRV